MDLGFVEFKSNPLHTHTDPQFEGKGCGFQRGSKIVDLGFVEFKSNGTKTNKTLEQMQKTQGETK